MKRRRVIIAAAIATAAALSGAAKQPAQVPSRQVEGIALGLFASTSDYDYRPLLQEMRSRGATDAMLVVSWHQRDVKSVRVRVDERTNDAVRRTAQAAQEMGMRVTLMPIIGLQQRTRSEWRGVIRAPATRWFESYRSQLLTLAHLAQELGTERLVVGSELGSMAAHTDAWRALIRETRTVYGGRIAYSANWDNYDDIGFWDAVDDVGVTGYFPLSKSRDPSPSQLAAGWAEPRRRLAALRRRVRKPVLLTEVGYPSHQRAAERPWDQHADQTADPLLQARLYRTFCDQIVAPGVTDGYFVWNWFGFGGSNDLSFTPRGKPAAAELESCMRTH